MCRGKWYRGFFSVFTNSFKIFYTYSLYVNLFWHFEFIYLFIKYKHLSFCYNNSTVKNVELDIQIMLGLVLCSYNKTPTIIWLRLKHILPFSGSYRVYYDFFLFPSWLYTVVLNNILISLFLSHHNRFLTCFFSYLILSRVFT